MAVGSVTPESGTSLLIESHTIYQSIHRQTNSRPVKSRNSVLMD